MMSGGIPALRVLLERVCVTHRCDSCPDLKLIFVCFPGEETTESASLKHRREFTEKTIKILRAVASLRALIEAINLSLRCMARAVELIMVTCDIIYRHLVSEWSIRYSDEDHGEISIII